METEIRILHIDDSQHDRQLVKDALLKEPNKFEIVEADSREKFEQYLDEKDYDIILSDFNILGFDGLQVLQIVKEKHPDIPVIIVTGTGSEEIAIQAMKMGAADYVIKTVKHIRGLAPTIQMVMEKKKMQDEHKIAQKALRESEEKYRKIFENVQDVFYQIDTQGIIKEISPSIFKFAGFLREELIGIPMVSLYHDPKEHNVLMDQIGLKGEVWDYEVRILTKTNHVKYASLNAHIMLSDENEQIGIEGSLHDINKRKQVEIELIEAKEKAEESNRLKTAFLHNISHEIRTPINAIVGFSGILNKADLTPDKRKYFTDIIIQSSDQLLSIITDIISIATIEAGQEIIHENDININTICNLLHEQFFSKTRGKNISFQYKTELTDDEVNIRADKIKLIQILTNLIDNAIKFTKQGHVNFGYLVKDDVLEFFVEDTGIGIPAEMHKEIFKRFRQVENTSTREFGGSGLGLSISKAYVELLGGKIWLTSELNKGSTFYFTIPTKKAPMDTLTEKQSDNGLKIETKQTKTLLIVEDEDANFILLEELLSGIDINIIRAMNGAEAVEICKSDQQLDMVLMDLKMPVMDGFEATKRIREFMPALPIIAQTAYSADADKNKAIESGCNDFISKPFKQEQFIAKINEQISKS